MSLRRVRLDACMCPAETHDGPVRMYPQGPRCTLHSPAALAAAGTPITNPPDAEKRKAWDKPSKPPKPLGLPKGSKRATAVRSRK